jgi:hypothetical protein
MVEGINPNALKITTWEFDSLTFLKQMNGQIIKIRNKTTGQKIELNEDTGEVSVFQADGSVKKFKNLRKALKFNWVQFHSEDK